MEGGGAFKNWLLDKVHGLLGVKPLRRQLAQACEQLHAAAVRVDERQQAVARSVERLAEIGGDSRELLAEISSEVAAMRGDPASRSNVAPSVPQLEALRALERQGLFILGCARSGTTILARSLNRSPEILLLEEPSFFLHEQVGDFATFFNQIHSSIGNRCMKGTYLPPPLTAEAGPLAALLRLRGDYRYLGEKTAAGPHDYPPNWTQAYLDFQGKYFFHAKYISILRTPVEAVWSMHKMFPDRPVSRLFETWLRTAALSLDAYHVFPDSRVVFFDDLGQEMVERLSRWLQLSIPALPGTFARKYINSALPQDSIPEPLLPFADLCRECTDLYRELRGTFSKDDFVYRGPETEWSYFSALLRRLQKMIDELPSRETSHPGGLRIAA